MSHNGAMKTVKKRDAARTRQAILQSAAQKFSEQSYDSVGLREIAESAGVNVAMVNRYFGSKENLYAESVVPSLDIDALLEGDQDDLSTLISQHMLTKDYAEKDVDPLLAVIRSAGCLSVKPIIQKAFDEIVVTRMQEKLSGDHTEQRAILIIALLFGFDALRRIIELESLSKQDNTELNAVFSDVLELLIKS